MVKKVAKIKIPKGWRRMRFSERIHKGDRFWFPYEGDWMDAALNPGQKQRFKNIIYIRRNPAPKKKGKKG
jgi:hypothetical protein